MNSVYKPLIDKVTTEEWGVCEGEQKRDFSAVFEKFGREL
jgi:dynein heavy chain